MPTDADRSPRRRLTSRTFQLDAEMNAWIAMRAQEQSTSESTIVRQAIKAAMAAEREQQCQERSA